MKVTGQIVPAEQLFAMPDDGFRYDLVDGALRKMSPAGHRHGAVAMNLGVPIGMHCKSNKLGVVYAAETGFKLSKDPDTVLGPDLAFVRGERIPPEGFPPGCFPGPPDLAVEVVSPDDSAVEVEEKVQRYLKTGVQIVCTVNPKLETVAVYRSMSDIRILTIQDVLTLEDLRPGFSLPVRQIFE